MSKLLRGLRLARIAKFYFDKFAGYCMDGLAVVGVTDSKSTDSCDKGNGPYHVLCAYDGRKWIVVKPKSRGWFPLINYTVATLPVFKEKHK
jgi:hypothetical protein